jgi:hypothetical protein
MPEKRLPPDNKSHALTQSLLRDGMNPKNPLTLLLKAGTHNRLPQDIETKPLAIIGEITTGPHIPIYQLSQDLVLRQLSQAAPSPNQENTLPQSPPPLQPTLEPPKALPITPGVDTSTRPHLSIAYEAYQRSGIPEIRADGYITTGIHGPQLNTNAAIALSESLLIHFALFAAAEKAAKGIAGRTIHSPIPNSEPTPSSLSAHGQMRRMLLKAGLYTGLGILSTATLNHFALSTDVLGRRDIDPQIGALLHDTLFTLPEAALEKLNKRYHYLYKSTMTLRNLNMALNTIHSVVALSHCHLPRSESKEVLSWYGIMHLGIPAQILSGSEAIAQNLRQTLTDMIITYADYISRSEDVAERRGYLVDFLFSVSNISPPIANQPISALPGTKLPPTGIDCLWQAMADASTTLRRDQATNGSYQLMLDALINVHTQATTHWGHRRTNELDPASPPRTPAYYTNIWRFDDNQPFSLLLPQHLLNQQASANYPRQAILLQNKTPYPVSFTLKNGITVQPPHANVTAGSSTPLAINRSHPHLETIHYI